MIRDRSAVACRRPRTTTFWKAFGGAITVLGAEPVSAQAPKRSVSARPAPARSDRAISRWQGAFAQVSTAVRTRVVSDRRTGACWGANFANQTLPPNGTFDNVSTGRRSSCEINTDGTIKC